MEFANDLLYLSRQLAILDGETPRQATLRRSISTAYYALFHLLISSAAENWNRTETRAAFGRLFEHGKMKSACDKCVSDLKKNVDGNPSQPLRSVISEHLLTVAKAFVQIHQLRSDADYDVSIKWTQSDVILYLGVVSEAFKSWQIIKEEPAAQDFLFSMLSKNRG